MSGCIGKVIAVYFSATGNTRRTAVFLGSRLAEIFAVPMEEIDFTAPEQRKIRHEFGPDELVVFASPTYAGKLPNKIMPYMKEGFSGGGAFAAAAVTFGNRAFDNSLAELASILRGRGFRLLGGGAFACRHAFTDKLAADRPDADDEEVMAQFADAVAKRVDESEAEDSPDIPGDADAPYYTPKGLDGKPKVFLKAKPKTDTELCTGCGLCAERCPMGSISINSEDFSQVTGICIKCHACVRFCPVHAKYFDDEAFLSHRGMLERDFQRRAPSVWFV